MAVFNQGIAKATYNQYAAALEKLGQALELYSEKKGLDNPHNLQEGIEATRDRAERELARFDGSRAYDRPNELARTVSDPRHRLAGQIQIETGIRLNEVSQIRLSQISGNTITVKGKGGKVTHRELSQPPARICPSAIQRKVRIFPSM